MIRTLQKAYFEPGRRIIVISDIHGHLDHLKALLKKTGYGPKDILVILGDMIERGHRSLGVLRFLMELDRNPNTYVLMGNVDLWEGSLVEDPTVLNDAEYLEHQITFIGYNGKTMFLEMLEESGIPFPETPEAMSECRKYLTGKYKAELDFIRERPLILETETMNFVHGGMPNVPPETLTDTDPYTLTKNDLFLRQGYRFDKLLIVGHWPALNYRDDEICLDPLYSPGQKIWSIDGGMGVTRLMQLNALIFTDKYDEKPQTLYWDELPKACAMTAQKGKKAGIVTHFPHNSLQILEKRETVARIRHDFTGRELWVPCDLLYSDTNGDNFTDELLEIEPGDEFGIVSDTEMGYLVKKDGRVGWYKGKIKGLQ